jgi:hypothetical protein
VASSVAETGAEDKAGALGHTLEPLFEPMVPHESDLENVLCRMTFTVEEGRFVLAGFPEEPVRADFELLARTPGQIVRERDETTLLVRAECRSEIVARHPGSRVLENLAWIRFEAPLTWDVVGFLARVASELAEEGIPIGAVCGFSRDSLFVDERYLPRARARLSSLFQHPGANT